MGEHKKDIGFEIRVELVKFAVKIKMVDDYFSVCSPKDETWYKLVEKNKRMIEHEAVRSIMVLTDTKEESSG